MWVTSKSLLLLFCLSACASGSHQAASPDVRSESPSAAAAKYPPFVLEVNDRVLAEVTVYTQTPVAKKEFKDALKRMKRFEPKTAPIFEKQSLPPELLVIPVVQTSYTNLHAQSKDDEGGTGIWKFAPFTANTYGLVTEKRDDRLLIAKETQAAAAYLAHLFGLFHDWRFVLIGYCEGEGWLTAAMEKHPSANPWEIELTITDSKPCLSQTMAALYVMQHQDLLK
jgi:membrane-bound lytic murein transglycosylase D